MSETIGFTGSRYGMSAQQSMIVEKLLEDFDNFNNNITTAHNGGCVGADEQFEAMCDKLQIPSVRWPANDVQMKWVSRKEPKPNTTIMKATPHDERNARIVYNSTRLIATPNSVFHPRSGTWQTIHKAIDEGRRVYIVLVNGMVDVR